MTGSKALAATPLMQSLTHLFYILVEVGVPLHEGFPMFRLTELIDNNVAVVHPI